MTRILAVTLLLAVVPSPVLASRCFPPPIHREIERAEAVVRARTLSVEGNRVQFEVIEQLSGSLQAGERFEFVLPEDPHPRRGCSTPRAPSVGAERLIFAVRVEGRWTMPLDARFSRPRPSLLRSVRAELAR